MVKFLQMKDLILNENEINALTDINRYLKSYVLKSTVHMIKHANVQFFGGNLTELFGKN